MRSFPFLPESTMKVANHSSPPLRPASVPAHTLSLEDFCDHVEPPVADMYKAGNVIRTDRNMLEKTAKPRALETTR